MATPADRSEKLIPIETRDCRGRAKSTNCQDFWQTEIKKNLNAIELDEIIYRMDTRILSAIKRENIIAHRRATRTTCLIRGTHEKRVCMQKLYAEER